MELVSVAAVAENGVIGRDGEIPWPSIPEDREQYRRRIAGDPVILGRSTFESMRDDLPGRAQIVMSRTERSFSESSAYHAGSVEEALECAASMDAKCVYVIGGAAIYRAFFPRTDRLILSRVHGAYEGDATFPEWNEDEWCLVSETAYDRFTLEEWERAE